MTGVHAVASLSSRQFHFLVPHFPDHLPKVGLPPRFSGQEGAKGVVGPPAILLLVFVAQATEPEGAGSGGGAGGLAPAAQQQDEVFAPSL